MERSILLVSNLFDATRGSWGVCLELAEQLSRTGWRVLTTSAWRRRRWRPLDMLWTVWRQRDQYELAHVDVFSGTAFRWAEAVTALLQKVGKPYVLSLHGGNLPIFALKQPQRVGRLLQSAPAVTTPSRYLLTRLEHLRSDILLLPNPLTLAHYKARCRTALQPKLVWLRSFHTMYNPCLAVDVVAQVRREFPAVQLTMIGRDKGDGSLQATRRRIADLDLADCITIIEGIPKRAVPGRLADADLFLNTTTVDNTPISVLEALATGLCVVSTEAGGIPFLLTNEVDALLVPPSNVAAMAEAVCRLLRDAGLAGRLSQAALATADRYDWSMILPLWEQLLTSVARAGAIE
jgi:glycosyltransferase involved in cell wall biosynthesis